MLGFLFLINAGDCVQIVQQIINFKHRISQLLDNSVGSIKDFYQSLKALSFNLLHLSAIFYVKLCYMVKSKRAGLC
jgi:hypothetical protein